MRNAVIPFLIISLFVAMLPRSLPAKSKGKTVTVTMIDDKEIVAELLAVKDFGLVLYDSRSRQGQIIETGQITGVTFRHGSYALSGMGVGAGLALLLGLVALVSNSNSSESIVPSWFVFPIVGIRFSLTGLLIGSLITKHPEYQFSGKTDEEKKMLLQKLDHFAREPAQTQ